MSKLSTFIIGGAIGAGAALLLAPHDGLKNREIVMNKMNAILSPACTCECCAEGAEGVEGAECTCGEGVADDSFFSAAAAIGSKIANKASAYVQEAADAVAPVFSSRDDELREKIEAARARIASQVAANAAQAVDAEAVAAEAIEAEVVEEAAAEAAESAQA